MPQSKSKLPPEIVPALAERVADHAPLLLVYLDRELRVRFANRHCQELFGHAPRELLGRLLAELVDARTLEHALDHVAELERGNQAPREYLLRTKQGERKFVQVCASADRDAQGRSIGYFASAGGVAHSLGELVGSVVCEMSVLAAERGVSIETRADGEVTRVSGNPYVLRQALARLVAAAIGRSYPGGVVRVNVGLKGDKVTFLVEDEGADALSAGHLGLCISKAVLERHGGSVRVVNFKEGGAAIHVELPRLATSGKDDQP